MINVIGRNPSAQVLRDIANTIDTTNDITICWGARQHTATGIGMNCVARKDAREQLQAIANAGLNVPVWTDQLETAKQAVRLGGKIWGRNWIHTRGTDIIGAGYKTIRTKQRKLVEHFNPTWLKREWWVQVIPFEQIVEEWRIHIFQGRSLGRGLKTQTGQANRIQPVRNRDNGWTMVHNIEPTPELKTAAAQAVKACGYNFGAVDLFKLNDGKIVILEVNTAPALRSQYTIDAYTTALNRLAAGKWLEWRDKDFAAAKVEPIVEERNAQPLQQPFNLNYMARLREEVRNQADNAPEFFIDYNGARIRF